MSIIEKMANKFRKDGVDHIRISPFAETNLGKISSSDWRKKYFVPHMGEFLSPGCFAKWIGTGDDEARHNPKFRSKVHVERYHELVLYAKFYQLCSLKHVLVKEYKNIPFAAYKQHQNGLKEFDRWKDYPFEVKEMIQHIITKGVKEPYNWEEKFPGLIDFINKRVKELVGDTELPSEPEESVTEEPIKEDVSEKSAA